MSVKKWISFTIFGLILVAILGVLMRYKIAYSFPFANQKHLQHSHSHFAMTGWLTQLIMILIADSVSSCINPKHFKKYNFILTINLITSYGMLFSFLYQGYGAISIFFSTLSILVVYYFGVQIWKDMNKAPIKLPSFKWFKASIIFAVLSSFAVAMLAYLMVTKNVDKNLQQATTYFFLHFQYNGWLIFSCLGLFINIMHRKGIQIENINKFFWLYAGSCIPAYLLSTLWLHLPTWLYIIVVISGLIVLLGWLWFINQLRDKLSILLAEVPKLAKWLMGLSATAFTIKVLLQAGSTIPSLNNMAFGYRPIVIGYLHLIFLGVITLFVLGYLVYENYLRVNKTLIAGSCAFVIGIILNELALMVQGLSGMVYYNMPYINEMLLIISFLMFVGIVIINFGVNQNRLDKVG